jgi:hypothetical protein
VEEEGGNNDFGSVVKIERGKETGKIRRKDDIQESEDKTGSPPTQEKRRKRNKLKACRRRESTMRPSLSDEEIHRCVKDVDKNEPDRSTMSSSEICSAVTAASKKIRDRSRRHQSW